VAAAGDYDASEVGNDSSVSGATVKDALDTLSGSVAGKQAGDSDLTALAGVAASGMLARTGSGTAAARTITAGTGISVTNGDGVAGNPTIAGTAATTSAYGDVRLGTELRERLAANRTYYVRTDGSDANAGLVNSSGGAFLTIQKALNAVAALDIGTFDVTIQVADGTYSGANTVTGPWLGSGGVTVQGNTGTPANVIISVTGTDCFLVRTGGRLTVSGMELRTTTAGSGLHATTGAAVTIGASMRFGTIANFQLYAETNAAIVAAANYSVVGGALAHFAVLACGIVQVNGFTVTVSGTPGFAVFASAGRGSALESFSSTYSGSATGQRYSVSENSLIFTNGGGANFFPGNSAGSSGTGGLYA
jgi:hypothetical protein